MIGTVKLKFEGGRVGQNGLGWGFVIRNANGDVNRLVQHKGWVRRDDSGRGYDVSFWVEVCSRCLSSQYTCGMGLFDAHQGA